MQTVGQAKLKSALEKNQKGDPAAIEIAIDQEVEKEKRKIAAEYQKKVSRTNICLIVNFELLKN